MEDSETFPLGFGCSEEVELEYEFMAAAIGVAILPPPTALLRLIRSTWPCNDVGTGGAGVPIIPATEVTADIVIYSVVKIGSRQ